MIKQLKIKMKKMKKIKYLIKMELLMIIFIYSMKKI